jgi:hypothetical protein
MERLPLPAVMWSATDALTFVEVLDGTQLASSRELVDCCTSIEPEYEHEHEYERNRQCR